MLNKQVNLTQLYLIQEIQHFLLECQQYKDNAILHDLVYQRQIIEYVLSNLDRRYMVDENPTEISGVASNIFPKCALQKGTVIRQLLQTKILDLLRFLVDKPEQLEFSNAVMLEVSK